MSVTNNVKLLPLPEPDFLWPMKRAADDIPSWGEATVRQIVEANTEALRAALESERAARVSAQAGYTQQKARAERLVEALRLAEEHIDGLTPDWYSAGQRVLAAIRDALRPTAAQEPRN